MARRKRGSRTFTGKRVYVVGVPDRYQRLDAQINRLERSSPQTYYVVVTSTTKSSSLRSSNTSSACSITGKARRPEPAARWTRIGPSSSWPPSTIRRSGFTSAQPCAISSVFTLPIVNSDLINKTFIGLAKDGKYPEAISSLLDATNDWIAARDSQTAFVSVKVPAAAKTSGSTKTSKASSSVPAATPHTVPAATPERPTPLGTGTGTLEVQDQPQQSSFLSSPFMFLLLGVAVVAGAILGLLWFYHRSASLRLAGQIKEIKSKAVDVMDRLDSLKERLKLLPTSPEFREPMAGATQALYHSANEKTRKLWDGWLAVMEALEKAAETGCTVRARCSRGRRSTTLRS